MDKQRSERVDRRLPAEEDEEYILLGDAVELTRNGKATATEANRGKG